MGQTLPELFVDNIDIVKVSEVEEQLDLLTENNSVHNSDINSLATKLGNIFVNSAELSYGKLSVIIIMYKIIK